MQGLEPVAPSGRKWQLAMLVAVSAVFGLSYLDSRREERRALADFSAEQATLARTFALTIADRMRPDIASEALFAEVVTSADAEAPTSWIVMDDSRRWTMRGPLALSWRFDSGATPNLEKLLTEMANGGAGARFLDRDSAEVLGLGQRSAVAGFAPVASGWSVAVVASARRVRDRGALAVWRLAAATALAALIVGVFALGVSRQRRRADELAAALRLAATTAALRERSEKIVEAIPLGVIALDRRGSVTSVNAYLVARGCKAHVDLDRVLPVSGRDERGQLWALVREARLTRRPVERPGLPILLGGDRPRDIDAYAIPLENPLPEVDCFLLLHDRTDVRVLEHNLRRAEKLATIGTLAAGVAHEVGTPLGIISGRAEQLLARLPEGELTDGMRRSVSSILTQVDKVSTTIRQLLDFARVRPVERTNLAPAEVLAAAAALLEHHFRRAGVALHIDASPTAGTVAADPAQLEQVLVNLLMNACDACAAAGHVVARAIGRGAMVDIEIVDDGHGISPEHLSAVFDPFFTTKKRGQGTGLGLPIAADIVKNHGGTVEIDSLVGQGTTVRVRLPAVVEGSAA